MTKSIEAARICPSCDTKKGAKGAGFTGGDFKVRAGIVAAFGLPPLLVGLGFLVKGDGTDFMLMGDFTVVPFAIVAVTCVGDQSPFAYKRKVIA